MILLSILFIFLVHYLIHFFKSTLTVPKIKDMLHTQKQYEDIFHILKEDTTTYNTTSSDDYPLTHTYEIADLLPKSEDSLVKEEFSSSSMKGELKHFLKQQMNVLSNGTDISSLDSIQENTYSTY
jgi:hypothetical protein